MTPLPKTARASKAPARDTEAPLRPQSYAESLLSKFIEGRARPAKVKRAQLRGDFQQAVQDGAANSAAQTIESRVRAHLSKGAVQVKLTDNRYTMISVRRERENGPNYKVRLHHMFADASPAVMQALARYVESNDPRASRVLGDYIDAHQHRVRRDTPRSPRQKLETAGQFHDLRAIYADLNRRYFDGKIEARITWGQRTSKPRRRNSIKMGSYSVEDRLIRIHRSLDREFVPRFFVEWIVYHEMLHQVHKVRVVGGRRIFHPPEFLAQEAEFEHYARARAWERANLDALLCY